jgi:hypothetical protein
MGPSITLHLDRVSPARSLLQKLSSLLVKQTSKQLGNFISMNESS